MKFTVCKISHTSRTIRIFQENFYSNYLGSKWFQLQALFDQSDKMLEFSTRCWVRNQEASWVESFTTVAVLLVPFLMAVKLYSILLNVFVISTFGYCKSLERKLPKMDYYQCTSAFSNIERKIEVLTFIIQTIDESDWGRKQFSDHLERLRRTLKRCGSISLKLKSAISSRASGISCTLKNMKVGGETFVRKTEATIQYLEAYDRYTRKLIYFKNTMWSIACILIVGGAVATQYLGMMGACIIAVGVSFIIGNLSMLRGFRYR